MTPESKIELQKLDCNCNDCIFLFRDLEKFRSWDWLYDTLHGGHKQSWRIHYGKCSRFNKEVQFTPEQCQLHTQECFVHRKDFILAKECVDSIACVKNAGQGSELA